MSKQLRMLMLAVMALFITVGVQAQITTAAMGGRVIDDTCEAVIGASVRAVHEPSGSVYGAVTNVDGRYSIQGMRTGGPYTVTVSYVGYTTKTFSNLTMQLGEVFNLNVDLS
ncbi:MAG: carboxypeptidase regulatory-like domain-containing protein, partial [Bacteroidaceae bacterium]|nr:carboxypeptidase regulatory-like domain-containing protein [Bacteroidaceae bacterium]